MRWLAAVVALLCAGAAWGQGRPDFTEFPGTQARPECAVRIGGRWSFYSCGRADAAQRFAEARQTVWVDGFTTERRISDRAWWLATLVNFAAAAADVEMTQRALRAGLPGREGNPLLGTGRARGYGIGFGAAALAAWASHHRKAALERNRELGIAPAAGPQFWNKLPWWSAPMAQAAGHVAGILSAAR